MELVRETRWSRHYSDELLGLKLVQSKFADGAATITLEELDQQWPTWKPEEKADFCHAINEAKLDILPDIYRYIMKVDPPDYESWSAIAAWVVRKLPEAKYAPWLEAACLTCPVGKGEKLLQAFALSKTPRAIETLRKCLHRAWNNPQIFVAEGYIDHAGMDAVVCMECLLQLDAGTDDFGEKYQVLANHGIAVNRESAVSRLAMYFQ